MSVVWWHWVAMGMVLVGLELIVPSFTIIWFGLGAILVGALTALFPGIPLSGQILLWTVTSIMFTIRIFWPPYAVFSEKMDRQRFDSRK